MKVRKIGIKEGEFITSIANFTFILQYEVKTIWSKDSLGRDQIIGHNKIGRQWGKQEIIAIIPHVVTA